MSLPYNKYTKQQNTSIMSCVECRFVLKFGFYFKFWIESSLFLGHWQLTYPAVYWLTFCLAGWQITMLNVDQVGINSIMNTLSAGTGTRKYKEIEKLLEQPI